MASRGLGTLTLDLVARIGGFTGPLDKAGRDLDKRMSAMEKRAYAFGRAIGTSLKIGAGIAAAGLGIYIKNTIEAEKVQAQLTARIKDTAGAAGRSLKELNEQSTKLMNLTVFDDEDIGSAQAALLTFTQIQGLNFDRTIEAATDLATVMGTDVTSAARVLGKALSDPEKAAGTLRKAGIALTEEQKELVKQLSETGDMAGAQAVLLDALAGKMGTAAEAARDTLGGALQGLKNSFNEMLEGDAAGGGLLQTTEAVNDLARTMNDPDVKQGVDNIVSGIASIVAEAVEGIGALQRLAKAHADLFSIADKVASGAPASAFTDRELEIRIANLSEQKSKARKGGDLTKVDALQKQITELLRENTVRLKGSIKPGATPRGYDKEVRGTGIFADVNTTGKAGGGGGGSSGGGRSGGSARAAAITDEQRAADQLLSVYERMEDSYREQVELAGDVTEVEKLRYELTNGEGAKFSETQKQTLLGLAAEKDAQEAENKLTQEAAALHQQLITPMEQINAERARAKELLDAGKISQEDYNRALDAQHTPAEQMLADLRFEAELLGKSREQQELLTAARYLGADAATEQGKAALAALEQEQQFRKSVEDQTEIMDAARDSARSFFDDLKEGKGVWDSLSDAAGNFADILYDIASRKLIEQIFGQMGTTGSGSTGGGWLDAIMSLFGGSGFGGEGSPLASGGWTDPNKFHQVGEHNRPELLMRNGKQYLIPGDRGRVEPMSGGGGGSFTQIIEFKTNERVTNRSRKQLAQAAGMAASEAIRSNGG